MLATSFVFTPYHSGEITLNKEPQQKTLESEINRLSIKYNVSSSTVNEIIKCESSMYGSATHINKDGSTDFGFLQVNDYWHKKTMEKMGLEITNQWDSLEFGFILMKSQGLKPWSASRKCWQSMI